MNWVVYIVLCNDLSLYTGITNDINRRLRQHNGEIQGGAKYTKNKRPCSLMWFSPSMSKSEASKLEFKIKKMKRSNKLKFVGDSHGNGQS